MSLPYIFADYVFQPEFETSGLALKYGQGIQFDDNLEDGHLDLMMVKEVSLGDSSTDVKTIAKKYDIDDTNCKYLN